MCSYSNSKINVLISIFYSGFVDDDKIENYVYNREKFILKGKGADFKMAVKYMDEYLSDPKV